MAERLTFLVIGDLVAVGTRPVSDLTAINAAYDDAQTDMGIWNIQAQAWQDLQPGVNTNTNEVSSDRWCFESFLREGIRSKKPTGKFWTIKFALDSVMLTNNAGVPWWNPVLASNQYSALVAQITAAAAAAWAVGDTIKIVGGLSAFGLKDWLVPNYNREFNWVYYSLIERLRIDIPSIAHCAIGSIRDDGVAMPWVAFEPHYAFGLSIGFQAGEAALVNLRTRTWMLQDETNRVHVQSTGGFATDNTGFVAANIIDLTMRASAKLFAPAAPDESGLPWGDMACLFGDSLAEGTGVNSLLPDYLKEELQDVKIWYPFLPNPNTKVGDVGGSFQNLKINVNNMTSLIPHHLAAFHGCEMSLGVGLRTRLGKIWLVKAAVPGTFASAAVVQGAGFIPPVMDPTIYSWDPSIRGQYAEMGVRSWLPAAISALRRSGKRPRARLVVISLGANDILNPVKHVPAANAGRAIRDFIAEVTKVFEENFVDTALLKFSLGIPRSSMAGIYAATEESVTALRAEIAQIATDNSHVFTHDLDAYVAGDGIHIESDGYVSWGFAAAAHIDDVQSVYLIQPLFMPSGDSLRRALRLSQVPDGNDATAQIDSAVEAMKVRFFQHLGEAKIDALKAIPYTGNPKTSQDYLRVLAANTEVKGVRAQLLRVMPTMFMDGSSTVQSWNEEAAFREGSILQTRDELKRLEAEIVQAMEVLQSSKLEPGGLSVSVLSPDSRIDPGDTVFKVF